MRRILVCLAACAILAPVSAQEPVPASTVTVAPNTVTRTSPFTRKYTRRSGEMVTVTPATTTTTTTVVKGEPVTMEPIVNSRGRITGYRTVTTPATNVTKTTETTNPVTQASNTETKVEKTETKVVTPTTMPASPKNHAVVSCHVSSNAKQHPSSARASAQQELRPPEVMVAHGCTMWIHQ